MANKMALTASKTYGTEARADIAAQAKFGHIDVRYFIARTADGRFFPVFVGQSAVQAGVHFEFNVVA